MTTPISNNNPGSVANNKPNQPQDHEIKGGGVAPAGDGQGGVAPKTDEVNLSLAGALLSQGSRPGSGNVQSAEQAAQLAQQIKAGIQADPAGALASQGGAVSESVMELLKTG